MKIASNNVFWIELIRTIFESFSINNVINKGKKYMNYSNEWYSVDTKEKNLKIHE